MLHLPDAWVWDFWTATDGADYHAFFLRASRAHHDPDRRHAHASIGHAVSQDLVSWTLCPDALVPSDGPAWDDQATWTGSVVRDGGSWRMFYTGVSRGMTAFDQRIGSATSEDLMTWHKDRSFVLGPAAQWYETHAMGDCVDEAWRDPFVMRGNDGRWHMLITARASAGPHDQRGVVGHAVSDDLAHWEVLPPLSNPGTGFSHLEVFQHAVVDGRGVLLFNCLAPELSGPRAGTTGGVWAINVDDPLAGVDTSQAYRLTDESLYVGKLVGTPDGWRFLAFTNTDQDGGWGGSITDPMTVSWQRDHLVVEGASR